MRALIMLTAALIALPAMAQQAVNPEEIGPNVDRDFWCATAFGLTSYIAGQAGDPTTSQGDNAKSGALFSGIATQMQAKGMAKEQFDQLTAHYTAKVMDPFKPADGVFTREQCETAVAELAAAPATEPAPTTEPAPATEPAPTTEAEPQSETAPAQ